MLDSCKAKKLEPRLTEPLCNHPLMTLICCGMTKDVSTFLPKKCLKFLSSLVLSSTSAAHVH